MGVLTKLTPLRGPPTPCTFFLPQIKFYDDPEDLLRMPDNPVRHLSSHSTWKSISSLHAEELTKWHAILMDILAEKLKPVLLEKDFRIREFTLEFNITKLAIALIDRLDNEVLIQGSLQSIANITQFTRLQRCWMPTSQSNESRKSHTGRLRVNKSSIQTASRRITFDDFVMVPCEGQNYYLRPRFIPAFPLSESSPHSPSVIYETPGCNWLTYHDGRFYGAVPRNTNGLLHVYIRATITHHFAMVPEYPFTPRHEEIIHIRLTLLPVVHQNSVYAVATPLKVSGSQSRPVSPGTAQSMYPILGTPNISPSTEHLDMPNSEICSFEVSNPFALLGDHSDMDESIRPRQFSFKDLDEMDGLVKLAYKSTGYRENLDPPQEVFDNFKKKGHNALFSSDEGNVLKSARDKICEMLSISIDLMADGSPHKEAWKTFREQAVDSTDPTLLKLCRDLQVDYQFDGKYNFSNKAEIYMFLREAFATPGGHGTAWLHARAISEQDRCAEQEGDEDGGVLIQDGTSTPGKGGSPVNECDEDCDHKIVQKLKYVPQPSWEDDGFTDQNVERMRLALADLEFGSKEDARDVREMKKALLNDEKRQMELEMLGRRVCRWTTGGYGTSSEIGAASGFGSDALSDIDE